MVETLGPQLEGYHAFHAARVDLLGGWADSARLRPPSSVRPDSLRPKPRASSSNGGAARPTGVGRGKTTYTIPIEGRDEWLAEARRQA
jgi:hypothetical protein